MSGRFEMKLSHVGRQKVALIGNKKLWDLTQQIAALARAEAPVDTGHLRAQTRALKGQKKGVHLIVADAEYSTPVHKGRFIKSTGTRVPPNLWIERGAKKLKALLKGG